jgi:hypothetical protein
MISLQAQSTPLFLNLLKTGPRRKSLTVYKGSLSVSFQLVHRLLLAGFGWLAGTGIKSASLANAAYKSD